MFTPTWTHFPFDPFCHDKGEDSDIDQTREWRRWRRGACSGSFRIIPSEEAFSSFVLAPLFFLGVSPTHRKPLSPGPFVYEATFFRLRIHFSSDENGGVQRPKKTKSTRISRWNLIRNWWWWKRDDLRRRLRALTLGRSQGICATKPGGVWWPRRRCRVKSRFANK